ncbi:protein-export chaperone SecB [Flavobacterium sp. 102]|uniref:protein-export chaperone SecB n=1 Tax=Flavobacterium sp. 102 TaxID=2135623 RepID=UPI000EB49DC2|nr:protein-export chaperone SecB [Flavobacterium sp. 102]RKS02882.1 preprotein translocase subunit SecB [Flavobacterium sp. 102]
MKIKLNDWKVQEMTFSVVKNDDRKEDSFDLKTSQFFPEDDKRSFSLLFEIDVKDTDFDMFIKMLAIFELDEDITEEFKVSDFPVINAPAIAFPYLRAVISNITLQAGYRPVMLPSINFVEFAKK